MILDPGICVCLLFSNDHFFLLLFVSKWKEKYMNSFCFYLFNFFFLKVIRVNTTRQKSRRSHKFCKFVTYFNTCFFFFFWWNYFNTCFKSKPDFTHIYLSIIWKPIPIDLTRLSLNPTFIILYKDSRKNNVKSRSQTWTVTRPPLFNLGLTPTSTLLTAFIYMPILIISHCECSICHEVLNFY